MNSCYVNIGILPIKTRKELGKKVMEITNMTLPEISKLEAVCLEMYTRGDQILVRCFKNFEILDHETVEVTIEEFLSTLEDNVILGKEFA